MLVADSLIQSSDWAATSNSPRCIVRSPGGTLATFYWAENNPGVDSNREKLYIATSTNGGATWTASLVANLSSEQVGYHHYAVGYTPDHAAVTAIACNQVTGAFHTVFYCTNRSPNGPHRIYHFTNETGSWIKTQLVSDITKTIDANTFPQVVGMTGTADGAIHMLLRGYRTNADTQANTWYSRWFSGWNLWTKQLYTETNITMGQVKIDMSPSSSNSIYIGGVITSSGTARLGFQTRTSLGTWSGWNTWTTGIPFTGGQASMLVDPSDQSVYFICNSYSSTHVDIARYKTGLGWDDNFSLSLKFNAGQTSGLGSLSKDSLGTLHAIYHSIDDTTLDATLYYRSFASNVWSDEVALIGSGAVDTDESYKAPCMIYDYYRPAIRGYMFVYTKVVDDGLPQETGYTRMYKSDRALWYGDSYPPTHYDYVDGAQQNRFALTVKIDGLEPPEWWNTNFFPANNSARRIYRKIELENSSGRDSGQVLVEGTTENGTLYFAEGVVGDDQTDVGNYTFSVNVYLTPVPDGDTRVLWVRWDSLGAVPEGVNNYRLVFTEF